MRRLAAKSAVKCSGSTVALPSKLAALNSVEAGGMCGVAVKCLDIARNADCGGSWLDRN